LPDVLWNLVFLRTAILVILMAGSYWNLSLLECLSSACQRRTMAARLRRKHSLYFDDDVSAQEN